MYGQVQSETASTPSTSGCALGRGLGDWPAPAPRSTGYSRAFMQDIEPASPPPLEPVISLETPHKQSSTTKKPIARIIGPPRGTMELLPVPTYRGPETPTASRASMESVSPSKSTTPAWAASLEKALAEDNRKLNALATATSSTTSQIPPRSKTARKKSIPPHLRRKGGDGGKASLLVSSAEPSELILNPNAKVFKGLVMRGDSDEALALTMAIAEPGVEHAKHVSLRKDTLSVPTNMS
jgi:hypothetical protein